MHDSSCVAGVICGFLWDCFFAVCFGVVAWFVIVDLCCDLVLSRYCSFVCLGWCC